MERELSSGQRATFVREMTPELATRVGRLLGNSFDSVSVCLDNHPSSPMVDMAFRAGAISTGTKITHYGFIPSCIMPFAPDLGECYVTIGSHDQERMSGIELHRRDGSFFDESDVMNMTSKEERLEYPDYRGLGRCIDSTGAMEAYIDKIGKIVGDVDCSIALDFRNSTPSYIAARIAAEAGAETLAVRNVLPNGVLTTLKESDLMTLSKAVKRTESCRMGAVISHDGSRAFIFDDEGRMIPSDKLAIILANHYGLKKLMVPVDFTMAAEDFIPTVLRTTKNIMDISNQTMDNQTIGADGKGYMISPAISRTPDGIATVIMLLNIITEEQLSTLVDGIPDYSRTVEILRVGAELKLMSFLKKEIEAIDSVSVLDLDGCRVTFESGWFLLHLDPVDGSITITCEAKDKAYMIGLTDIAKGAVAEAIRKADL